MKYRFPKEYEEIQRQINETSAAREEYIRKFNAPIIEALDRNGFKYEISGRIKSVYSIWTKMMRKQIPFSEIYDLFAIRIVFQPTDFPSEKTQCWQIYSSITDIYTPKPDRLRDWISIPKANGYEALHSTVMGPDGIWVEVQIRTQRMEDVAERGFAAHWKYKHATISHDEDEFDKWLKMIRTALDSPTQNAIDFLDNFKLSLYTSEIAVFTPKGEARHLPYGATALDFAYDVHTKIGNGAIGAKINHKIAPITTQLSSGDQVEIITAESARPKAEWLEFVITAKAKQAIKNFLKREQEHNLQRGLQMLDDRLAQLNITPNHRVIRKLIEAYECSNKDELYTKIGAGIVSLDNLEKIVKTNSKNKILKFWTLFIKDSNNDNEKEAESNQNNDISKQKSSPDNQHLVIAECCRPLPGDSVVGYRDPVTHQIIVHKATCDELNRLASQRGDCIVKEAIQWSQYKTQSSLATIEVVGIDRMGLLIDLTNVITNDFSVNMRQVNIQTHDGIFEGTLSLYVRDAESLNAILDRMRRIKGMESVKRLD